MGQINSVSAPVVLRLALLCLGITPSHLAWMFYAKFMQVISNTAQTGAHQAWRGQWIALSNRREDLKPTTLTGLEQKRCKQV